MSNELQLTGFPSGNTLYAIIRNSVGLVWYPTGAAFEDWGDDGRTANDYSIPLADKTGSFYVGDFDSDIAASTIPYPVQFFAQDGVAPADADSVVGEDAITWNGVSADLESAVAELGATDICNMSLARIGGGKEQSQIFSLNESSPTAAWCRLFYTHSRNYVFKRAHFHEATEFGDLGAELTGSSLPEQADWEYVFNLPSDFLSMVKQTNEDDRTAAFKYRISQGLLFTNTLSNSDEDSAYIEYIIKNTDASTYGPELVEAIVVFLASKLAGPVAKDDIYARELLQEFELLALPKAKVANQADLADINEKGETTWLNAR